MSDAQRRALEVNGIPPLTVVYNGVDPSAMVVDEPTLDSLKARLGLADRKVVLFGGRFTGRKGRAQLLEAFSRVVDRVPDAALLILTSRASWESRHRSQRPAPSQHRPRARVLPRLDGSRQNWPRPTRSQTS